MKLTKEDRKAIIYSIWALVLAYPVAGIIKVMGLGEGIGIAVMLLIIVSVLIYWSMRFVNKKDKK